MEPSKLLLLLIVLSFEALSIDDTLFFDKSKPNAEVHLVAEDFERGRYSRLRLRQHSTNWSPSDAAHEDVLYRRDRFEGDIVGIDARSVLQQILNQSPGVPQSRGGVARSAVRSRLQTWPSRRVPYAISSQYSSFSRSRIASALEEYARKTCIRFVPRTQERDYVFITPDDGCYSTIGRAGGRQLVSIGSGCVTFGIIIHELMHSVGFFHEQSRPDRDEYVIVNWTNVADDMKDQFIKYNYGMINTMGFDYDYGSVMHYSNRAFTKNGLSTLVPRADGAKIGQREGFSHLDMTKINALYSCDDFVSHQLRPPIGEDQSTLDERGMGSSTNSPLPNSDHCVDKMDDCAYRKSLRYCETIPHWMNRYCPRTCGVCAHGELVRRKAVKMKAG